MTASREARNPRVRRPLTHAQWETTLRVLTDARRLDELWQRLPAAPLPWARTILTVLGEHRWAPTDADRAAYHALLDRAQACREPLSARARFTDGRVLHTHSSIGISGVSPRGRFVATTDPQW